MASAMGEMKGFTEKWIKELRLTEKDMEVITADENADGDMMAAIFEKYATTRETEEMVLRGARESLDIDRAFTVGLCEAAKLLD